MVVKASDQWETPTWLFDELNAEFNFDIDLCADQGNKKCDLWSPDYLNNRMINSREYPKLHHMHFDCAATMFKRKKAAFMNPPYSNPRPFVEKAFKDAKENKITIVCLLKCDPSTRTWAVFWDYGMGCFRCDVNPKGKQCARKYRGPKPGVEVRFLPKRVKYDPPPALKAEYELNKRLGCKLPGPTFPSCVVIFRGHEMS